MAGLVPTVFISHSTSSDPEAAPLVSRLTMRLREWGADPWIDLDHLLVGQIWNDELRRGIARCDAAVLVVTTRYVRAGAHYARDEALLFAQRAATESFDDFRLLVLLAPGITSDQLAADRDWQNLEIGRRQVLQLASLAPDEVDRLRPAVDNLLKRYRSGAVPLVLREHYADHIAIHATAPVLAQAAAAFGMKFARADATPRRLTNILLAASPELRRGLPLVVSSLHPWRKVLPEEVRSALGWDAVAFTWLDEGVASRVASVSRTAGQSDRKILGFLAEEPDIARLHLRRAREYVATPDDTAVDPNQTTKEGLIRSICREIAAKRARRERRDPLTVPAGELDALARDLNERVTATNPLVLILGREQCFPDLLEGIADLFSNVIFVALADWEQLEALGSCAVVLRPEKEKEVLKSLDAVTA